jgi:hypothetical protein
MTKTPHKPGCPRKTARVACFKHYGILKNGRYSDFEFKVFTNTLETAEPFQFSSRKAGWIIYDLTPLASLRLCVRKMFLIKKINFFAFSAALR